MEVVWSKRAKARLREIFDYLKQEANIKTAQKITDRLSVRPRILEQNPKAGQQEENLNHRSEGFRYLVEGNYKLLYFIEDETINITTIWDCRQDPGKMKEEVETGK